MREKVIQGFFLGGAMRAAPGVVRPSTVPQSAPALQRRTAPGRPAPAHGKSPVVQRHSAPGSESFEVDAVRLGLGRGGGSPLPQTVLAKMEAAFDADFSSVRVHVGPQASRIGAVAFTMGNDLYFAPGQYQPNSIQGQQLIGHELAHVIQQRQGRVRASGSGVSVVQDRALEAEADRLGMRAAAHVAVQRNAAPVQRKAMPGGDGGAGQVRVSAPVRDGNGRYKLNAQMGGRNVGSLVVHVGGGSSALVTDLGVDAAHRSQGVGKMLLASAAQTGLRFGKPRVALTADDNGSGKLNRWYGDLGFARSGSDARGRPLLEAQAGRILSGAAQPKMARGVRGMQPFARAIQRSAMSDAERKQQEIREAVERSRDRNNNGKAMPWRDREILEAQQTYSYGYDQTSIKYGELSGGFHKGWGGQPFMHGSKTDYDALVAKLTSAQGITESTIASTIFGVIDHGDGVLKYLPESIRDAAWKLIQLTHIVEPHSSRFPGSDKLARALLRAIVDGKATFKQCFNCKNGLFLPGWRKKAGAVCGGQQAMRIYLGDDRKKTDDLNIDLNKLTKIISEMPQVLSGGMSDSSDDDS